MLPRDEAREPPWQAQRVVDARRRAGSQCSVARKARQVPRQVHVRAR